MREKIQLLKDNVEMRIVGKGQVIDKIIICLLSVERPSKFGGSYL